ncbi:unnamed protein product, partial [Protopolystoma xenopodis]
MTFFGNPAPTLFSAQPQATQKETEVQSPPADTVSCLRFSPESVAHSTYLAATSWDNRIRIWEIMANGTTVPKAEQMHQAPAFGACWSQDGSKVFSVGADKSVQMWDLNSNQFTQIGAHESPAKTVHFISAPSYSCLMTG